MEKELIDAEAHAEMGSRADGRPDRFVDGGLGNTSSRREKAAAPTGAGASDRADDVLGYQLEPDPV
jgi:hypothetical protein